MDYDDHNKVIKGLEQTQGSQRDMRSYMREAHHFVNKRDGQWEQEIITRMRGKPRYTDDRVCPIVNQITGDMREKSFTLKIRPAGNDATMDDAKIYDGLVRNIRSISSADDVFNMAAKDMVEMGMSGWEIVADYAGPNSFDLDLMIKPIHDYVDRVFFADNTQLPTHEDSPWCIVLEYMTKEAAKEEFGTDRIMSLTHFHWLSRYYYKPDFVVVGRILYKKKTTKTLVKMSDGSVYEETPQLIRVLDDMERQGIFVEDKRDVEEDIIYQRYFDHNDWLDDEEETVFTMIPIVPDIANFAISEGKITCRGVVEKLMDPQRVHNYAFSRNTEEVALSPRKKFFMTEEQSEGYEEDIASLNTNMDPVQYYNHVPNVPPPYEAGGGQVNMAVSNLAAETDLAVSKAAGMFAANQGDNPGLQSGVAVDSLIHQGDKGTSAYVAAHQMAIEYTGKILINTIPRVYDSTRIVRLLQEDGTFEMKMLHEPVFDAQSGQTVYLNDLSKGLYDVVCDIGPAFKNRQQEMVDAFDRVASRDPSVLELGRDVFFQNMNAPGFDLVAERARAQMISAGVIPLEQLTEEERAFVEQQGQNSGPSIEEMTAQTQLLEAQAKLESENNKKIELQVKVGEIEIKDRQENRKTESKLMVDAEKINQGQQKIDLQAQQQEFEQKMRALEITINKLQALLTGLGPEQTNNKIQSAVSATIDEVTDEGE